MTQKKVEKTQKVESPLEFVFKPKAKTPEEFARGYQLYCEFMDHGLNIVPTWVMQDNNTYSMKQQTTVGRLPKQD